MSEFGAVVVVLVIFVVFVMTVIRGRRPGVDVDGRRVLYDRPCGVIVPMPFGFQLGSSFSISRVQLLAEQLVVVGAVSVRIPLEQIISIGLARRWLSQGVRIPSTNQRVREVFIYVRRPKELIDRIEVQRSAPSLQKAGAERQV